jgi:hypothetical protein
MTFDNCINPDPLTNRIHIWTAMQEIMEKAIEAYRRKRLLEAGNLAYAALKNDPKAWEQELAERKLWENTLPDGLDKA